MGVRSLPVNNVHGVSSTARNSFRTTRRLSLPSTDIGPDFRASRAHDIVPSAPATKAKLLLPRNSCGRKVCYACGDSWFDPWSLVSIACASEAARGVFRKKKQGSDMESRGRKSRPTLGCVDGVTLSASRVSTIARLPKFSVIRRWRPIPPTRIRSSLLPDESLCPTLVSAEKESALRRPNRPVRIVPDRLAWVDRAIGRRVLNIAVADR